MDGREHLQIHRAVAAVAPVAWPRRRRQRLLDVLDRRTGVHRAQSPANRLWLRHVALRRRAVAATVARRGSSGCVGHRVTRAVVIRVGGL
jgi:hypothetical protein